MKRLFKRKKIMSKRILFLLGATLILLPGNVTHSIADNNQMSFKKADLAPLQFKRIAVMPFLTGKLESPDNPVEKPLSQPLKQLDIDSDNLVEGAEQVMPRLVNNWLRIRFADMVVSMKEAAAAYADVRQDQTLDTPRKLAKKFGEILQADLVLVGTIWRFREKGAIKEIHDSPASIAFSVYLIEVASGKRLWRNAFDGTQKILSEDVFRGLKQIKIGLRWLSVNELARFGVKHVFRKFPLF